MRPREYEEQTWPLFVPLLLSFTWRAVIEADGFWLTALTPDSFICIVFCRYQKLMFTCVDALISFPPSLCKLIRITEHVHKTLINVSQLENNTMKGALKHTQNANNPCRGKKFNISIIKGCGREQATRGEAEFIVRCQASRTMTRGTLVLQAAPLYLYTLANEFQETGAILSITRVHPVRFNYAQGR